MKKSCTCTLVVTLVLLCSSLLAVRTNAQNLSSPPIVIGLTLNGSGESTLYPGWPLLVGVTIMNTYAYEANAPVVLLANWKNSLHFIVQDTAGNQFTWPFHIVATGDGGIALDSLTYAKVGYWLEADEAALIPAGEYGCTAVLDSTAYGIAGDSLLSVKSPPRRLKISNVPDTSGIGHNAVRDLLLANLNILKGNTSEAEGYLEGILGYDSGNITALSLLGSLLEKDGNAGGALRAYNKGVKLFYQENPNPTEPPRELLHTKNALLRKLNNAQSFVVTFAAKDTAHPAYGRGSPSCYYLDNIPSRPVQMIRGRTYSFHMKSIPATDPFYFSTNPKGGGVEPYIDGVSGAPADSNGITTIAVSGNTPTLLYYQSSTHEFAGWRISVSDSTGVTSVRNDNPGIPDVYSLSQAYPNPFNPATTITYTLPQSSHAMLTVYNVLGQIVATLFNGVQQAGYQSVSWNAGTAASGVYFYRLEARGVSAPGKTFTSVRKMVLMR